MSPHQERIAEDQVAISSFIDGVATKAMRSYLRNLVGKPSATRLSRRKLTHPLLFSTIQGSSGTPAINTLKASERHFFCAANTFPYIYMTVHPVLRCTMCCSKATLLEL